jgi:hypothetical protein
MTVTGVSAIVAVIAAVIAAVIMAATEDRTTIMATLLLRMTRQAGLDNEATKGRRYGGVFHCAGEYSRQGSVSSL